MDYFIFKDIDSREIKELIVSSLPVISKPAKRIENIEIDGKDGDIVEELGYQAYDKTLTITLIQECDINVLINWLNGKGKLVLSNEVDKYYEAEIIEQIDFDRLFKFEPIEIIFHCQPYKYLLDEQIVNIESNSTTVEGEEIIINNASTILAKLDISGNSVQEQTENSPNPINLSEIRNCGDNINYLDNKLIERGSINDFLNQEMQFASNSNRARVKNLISLQNIDTFTISCNKKYNVSVSQYDSQNLCTKASSTWATNYTFTKLENTTQISIKFKKADDSTITQTELQEIKCKLEKR